MEACHSQPLQLRGRQVCAGLDPSDLHIIDNCPPPPDQDWTVLSEP